MLAIDANDKNFESSQGTANSLNVRSPAYVGGLSERISREARNNLKQTTTSFPGCLRELHIQSKKYEFGAESIGYHVTPCSDKVENGAFFHLDGGYVTLFEKLRIGQRYSIAFDIKPRSPSGFLLGVFSSHSDHLEMYLKDGHLTFNVDNGAVSI